MEKRWFWMLAALLVAACSSPNGQETDVASSAAAEVASFDAAPSPEISEADLPSDVPSEPVACLGTVYPGVGTIDPDAPVYQDVYYTQEQVEKMFAQARQDDTKAYRAYRAALEYAHVLDCAFCPCGCALNDPKHVSAIDCFKDMHGFG